MATSAANVRVGAGVLSFGDYVAAGGAGSLTDVGHTRNVSLNVAVEDFDHETDRSFGIVKSVPVRIQGTIGAILDEATPENYRIAFRQPSGNKSGTPPNETLLVGRPLEQYHQATIVTSGIGTTEQRTFTFWKVRVALNGEIPFQKAAVQNLPIQGAVLYDDSVATNDKLFKMADA